MLPEEEDRQVLLTFLADLGVAPERIVRADQDGGLGALIVDAATGSPPTVSFEEAARLAGMTVSEAAVAWRALGFADPAVSFPAMRPEEVAVLELIGSVGPGLLGPAATLTLARILGETTSRIADAVVDAFRSEVEAPQRVAGGSYGEVVQTYADLVGTSLPQLQAAAGACLRRHLVTAAAAAWTLQDDETAPRRDLVVSFADLVGWTALARTVTPGHLVELVQRFERHVAEAATAHGTRIVKLLGDGAMLVSQNANDACAFGLQLVAAVDADGALPAVRVGIAAGPVLTLNGDYHGPVVNLAARLAAVASPSSVLTDEQTCARAHSVSFGRATTHELRGIPGSLIAVPLLPHVAPVGLPTPRKLPPAPEDS